MHLSPVDDWVNSQFCVYMLLETQNICIFFVTPFYLGKRDREKEKKVIRHTKTINTTTKEINKLQLENCVFCVQ